MVPRYGREFGLGKVFQGSQIFVNKNSLVKVGSGLTFKN